MEIVTHTLSILVIDVITVTDVVVRLGVVRVRPRVFRFAYGPVNVKKVHVEAVKGRGPPILTGIYQSCRQVSVLEAVINKPQFKLVEVTI